MASRIEAQRTESAILLAEAEGLQADKVDGSTSAIASESGVCCERFSNWFNQHEKTIIRVLAGVGMFFSLVVLGFWIALSYAPITGVLAAVLAAGMITAAVLFGIAFVFLLAYTFLYCYRSISLICE